MLQRIEKGHFKEKEPEIIYPKLSDKAIAWNEEELKKVKEYTEKINNKYQGELDELTEIAKNYLFEEVLTSEHAENPYVLPRFPKKQILPGRYLKHYSEVIKKIFPEKYIKPAMETMFLHEILHSSLKEAAAGDEVINKFYNDLAQTEKQLENLRSKKENTSEVKERLRLEIEESELSKKRNALQEKIDNFEEIVEMEVNRKVIKESPNFDAIAAFSLIEPMLSDGIIAAKVASHTIKKLQRKEPSLIKQLAEHFRNIFPSAENETIDDLIERYERIGSEIDFGKLPEMKKSEAKSK